MARSFAREAIIMLAAAQLASVPTGAARAAVTQEEAYELGMEAYIYAYPLVLMEITRRFAAANRGGQATNRFRHAPGFPDARFKAVVRPNADTLYSSMWYDVGSTPLVVSMPDTAGRYYVLPLMDMWTDVFATFGPRTTGTGAGSFVLVGPDWKGELPAGSRLVRSPTATGWIIGRIQANGPSDLPNVHKLQAGFTAAPLEASREAGAPSANSSAEVPVDTRMPPVQQIGALDPGTFFRLFAELMIANPPHAADYPVLLRMERLGIVPGRGFALEAASPEIRQGLARAVPAALRRIAEGWRGLTVLRNGWSIAVGAIGVYGTDFLSRAAIAYAGLGALPPEDALYPQTAIDSEGRPLDGANKYVLRFAKGQLPPARAFWSLSMYGADQLFVDNPINRYALGDRDPLVFGADGSLELYVQRDSPGGQRETNWLPAPAGPFSMNLRLYLPGPAAVDGSWAPPAVVRAP